MPETITITKAQLTAALARWEQDARDEKTVPIEEVRAMPVAEVAEASAAALWDALQTGTGG